MKIIRSTLTVIVAVGLIAGFSATTYASCAGDIPDKLVEIKKRGECRVCFVPSKPYQFKDPKTGELVGAVVEAAKELTSKYLKVKLKWVETDWQTMIAALQADKCDMIMSNTGRGLGRAESVWFTKPWIIGAQSFLVRKKDNIRNKADLDKPGNVIVVRLGSRAHKTYTEQHTDFFKNAKIKAVSPPALPEQEVASSRAIAWGAGMTETYQTAKANPDWAQSIILPETPRATGAGFIVPQCQHNLLHYMNVFVDMLIESQFMVKQAEKWGLVTDAIVAPTQTMGDLNRTYGASWGK